MTVKIARTDPLDAPTGPATHAKPDVSGALTILRGEMLALYVKTKRFHWHMSGSGFHEYDARLDQQANRIFAITDVIAEHVRKMGGTTRSIGETCGMERLLDDGAEYVTPLDMLAELRDDNEDLAAQLRETGSLCDEHGDIANASLLEIWADEAERRARFLFEAGRRIEDTGDC